MRYAPQDMTGVMGIGNYPGEVRRGPDGSLYQWQDGGVDGLGNPIGFWKRLKRGIRRGIRRASSLVRFIPGIGPVIHQVRGAVKGFCRVLPQVGPVASRVPAIRPYYRFGNRICRTLKKVGLAGAEGEIMMGDDGQHYEVSQGIGEFGRPTLGLRRVRLILPGYIQPGRARWPRKPRRRVRRLPPRAIPRPVPSARRALPARPRRRIRRFR